MWSIVQQVGFKDKGDSFSEDLWDNIEQEVIGMYLFKPLNVWHSFDTEREINHLQR